MKIQSIAVAVSVLLAACGGGGGGSSGGGGTTPPPVVTPPVVIGQGSINFANASVHDPSVIKVDGDYYVFGSHLAAAKTTDLMNWTLVADGVTASNPLFNDVTQELKDTFTWSQVTGLWAPDVVRLPDGKFYFYYDSCKGDSPLSALGVAVADRITGPYVNKQILLKSGMWNQISDDGVNVYDAQVHPNVVDPQTFFDASGKLWMIYGSYSGGIFILGMDATTGLPLAGQGYGKHLLGGYHARIEGAYVLHNAQTGYYYMFTSFGGLDAAGRYNIRVSRGDAPDGPYYDANGTDMSTVKGNPNLIFDDTRIAPYGQKLIGNHEFALLAGEASPALGYVSPGHNSAYFDAATGKYFIIFHTRFPGRGEQHELRVHELLFNEDGWPVMAPLRYVPTSLSTTPVVAEVTSAAVAGAYKYINHGKDITATIKASQSVRLNADGTISGAVAGTWLHKGNNYVAITLSTGEAFNGVLSRQWSSNANAFLVTFSVQSKDGVSIWGTRSGD
ncbi:MAG TPA: glycoside hydrolase family 43 protein [Povalibacter sp.]